METTPYGSLYKGFILGTAGLGQKYSCAVMFGHFMVGLVEHRFRSRILPHAGLEVVRRGDAGRFAKMALGIYMAGDSGCPLHMQKRFCVGAAAVGRRYHKQICIQPLSVSVSTRAAG